jgi:hypothetical protein
MPEDIEDPIHAYNDECQREPSVNAEIDNPLKSEEDSIGQFYFAPLPIQLSEHADGPANDLPASAVLVKLDPSQANWAISHKAGALVLEGTLRIGRHEDAQGTVSWFQLQLPVH